jgi:hypothetical protein
LVDFHEISGDAIVWGVKAIIFNSIASIILKWLRFKLMMWMYYLRHTALLNNGLGLFSFVWFPWLHHVPSLADVTMETKVCMKIRAFWNIAPCSLRVDQ